MIKTGKRSFGAALTGAEQRYQHLEPSYKLWREYLKRSEKYLDVCKWFEKENYKQYLLDLLIKEILVSITEITQTDAFMMNYLFFVCKFEDNTLAHFLKHDLEKVKGGRFNTTDKALELIASKTGKDRKHIEALSFFNWTFKKGFESSKEMLLNYFVFGEITNEPSDFKEFWPRAVFMLEARRKSQSRSVMTMESLLGDLFKDAESLARGDSGDDPNIHQFKEALRSVLAQDSNRLYLCIKNPTQTEGSLLKQINSLIKEEDLEEKTMIGSGRIHEEEHQFEYPTTIGRITELQRYLDVYDQKQKKKTNREIYMEMYPTKKQQHADPKRFIARDYRKAKKIIKNVEQGYFPGSYN